MHTSYRKTERCLNCDYPLQPDFNYCPRCSQENSQKLATFGTLMYEVVSNFLSYDSRFVQTIVPFLFRPGFLTKEFVAGRRIRYTHPLRLYVFVSVIYFSVLSVVMMEETRKEAKKTNISLSPAQADSIRKVVKRELSGELSPFQLQKIDSVLVPGSGNRLINLDVDVKPKKKHRENELEQYFRLINQTGITAGQVLDSLRWDHNGWNQFKVKQGMRLATMDKQEFIEYFMGKISLMMFVMLPFVTLFLKLLYMRRKRYYMEHLTFMLHIHAFLFFVLSMGLLWDHYREGNAVVSWATLISLVYVAFAFRKVYRQNWFKTLTKMFVLFIAYTVSLTVFLLLTLAVTAVLV